ncbi:MAG: UDP-N-acetylmuramate dehydrogenase [Clostridia bacterium]|nr:UDP-N-acetylmuramate dehydrogenase [Clostridia bacterium]
MIEQLKNINCTVLCDEPMRKHTSFRIGGKAKFVVIPKDEAALIALIRVFKEQAFPFLLIGNGSNVLFSDADYNGAVIQLADGLTDLHTEENGIIYCEAGVILSKLSLFALEQGLTGLEFAHGIPGSVGGAVFMNAGAYGGEMKDCIAAVRHMTPDGMIYETQADECAFSYRHSLFTDNGHIILGAYFRLSEGDKESIRARMEELKIKRKTSQPLDLPSAGSTFKRPETGYAAAHIDECGLKGCSVGGAAVSTKHAGFVVNVGNATAADVKQLMKHIQDTVFEKHGVLLQPEVVMLP